MTGKYKIITLGCRANQFESSVMGRSLDRAGLSPAGPDEPARVVVVNTCTVTHRADKQSRQMLRRAVRENPGSLIVAAGCLAELEGDDLAALDGVGLVVGRDDPVRLGELIADGESEAPPVDRTQFLDFGPAPVQDRSRALLKIQDGCDNACTYCRVRLARGRSRSLPPDRVAAAMADLTRAGYPEVVLTGIHLGFYGRDLTPPTDLTELVTSLLEPSDGPRIRLSSIEPTEITGPLLSAAAETDRFCPHFHLPLQSGDKGVLRAMNRPYDPDRYAEVIDRIVERLPLAAVGADVIVGFPGEDEAAFGRTLDLIDRLPLAYLHVFPYSPRIGTRAARLPGRVDPAVAGERAKVMRRLGRAKHRAYLDRLVGLETEVVVEQRRDRPGGRLVGVSPHYVRVVFDGPDRLMNRAAAVSLTGREGERLRGRLIVEADRPGRSD